jgi:hypothetical protein
MSLLINSILPANNVVDIPIDSDIIIEFDQEVDPFTINAGISIYTKTDQQWIGSELSILDTKYREVMEIGEEYSYLQYAHTVNGNIVTITPLASLLPNRKYYIAVFPGNDSERYVSIKTYSGIVYTRVGASDGAVEITGAYTGVAAATYKLIFTGANSFDLVKNGTEYIDSYSYVTNEELSLGFISISINGTFDNGDTAELDVFPAVGVENVYRNIFTTSEYETALPEQQSHKITNLEELFGTKKLQIVGSVPEDLSVNNLRINPIILKFNQELNSNPIAKEDIQIKRKNLLTGEARSIEYFYQKNGSLLKIFMINAE